MLRLLELQRSRVSLFASASILTAASFFITDAYVSATTPPDKTSKQHVVRSSKQSFHTVPPLERFERIALYACPKPGQVNENHVKEIRQRADDGSVIDEALQFEVQALQLVHNIALTVCGQYIQPKTGPQAEESITFRLQGTLAEYALDVAEGDASVIGRMQATLREELDYLAVTQKSKAKITARLSDAQQAESVEAGL